MLGSFFKNDSYIINSIKKGGSIRIKALEYCYKTYHVFQQDLSNKFSKTLSSEDIEEAYDDAFMVFQEQIKNDNFQKKAKLSTYFYAIFRNKCVDLSRKNNKNLQTSSEDQMLTLQSPQVSSLESMINEEEKTKLLALLDQLSEICKTILLLWNDGYNLTEIATKTGLKNANTAKAKKGTCFKKLKSLAKEQLTKD